MAHKISTTGHILNRKPINILHQWFNMGMGGCFFFIKTRCVEILLSIGFVVITRPGFTQLCTVLLQTVPEEMNAQPSQPN
jgi:hypothetical protein